MRKKGQMEMDKNLMSRKVYVKIYLSISIWPFLNTFMKKSFNCYSILTTTPENPQPIIMKTKLSALMKRSSFFRQP
jgi:hypothetical protein